VTELTLVCSSGAISTWSSVTLHVRTWYVEETDIAELCPLLALWTATVTCAPLLTQPSFQTRAPEDMATTQAAYLVGTSAGKLLETDGAL